MAKRTELFMTVEGAVLHLIRYGYKQDDAGEWYRRDDGLYETHATIERRLHGAAIKYGEPVEM